MAHLPQLLNFPSLLRASALLGSLIKHHAHSLDMFPQLCVTQIIKNRQVNGVRQ